MAKEQSAAILTIKEPGRMSARGRRDIVAWLRRQATHFLRHGHVYSDTRFTARYLYRDETGGTRIRLTRPAR